MAEAFGVLRKAMSCFSVVELWLVSQMACASILEQTLYLFARAWVQLPVIQHIPMLAPSVSRSFREVIEASMFSNTQFKSDHRFLNTGFRYIRGAL